MNVERSRASWWLLRIVAPVVALAGGAMALGTTDFDRHSLEPFFDPASGEFPLRRSWLFGGVLHDGGRATVFALAGALLIAGVWTLRRGAPRASAGRYFYLALCVAATTLLVGAWKDLVGQITPWNTLPFGGKHPWRDPTQSGLVRLIGSPGSHSSSGFAFLALYFVGASLGARRRWLWLAPGLMLGGLFALTQHVRGAHPPSHELWSLALSWGIASGAAALARRMGWLVWSERVPRAESIGEPDAKPHRLLPWIVGSSALLGGVAFFACDMLLEDFVSGETRWQRPFEIVELVAMSLGMGSVAWLLCSRILEARWRAAERLRGEREERFRVLGRMAASTAHEVRNSLQTLRLIVDEQRLEVPGLREHALQPGIDACLARIDHAVELIHGFARRERGEGEQADLAGATRDAVVDIERVFRERAKVRVEAPPASARVWAVDGMLRMVIDNLLRNAVEASPPDSVVDVELKRDEADWALAIRNARADDARVDLDAAGHSSKPQGLGLGLSIARLVTAQLGGTVEHEFNGLRVTCTLRLPACDAEAPT